MAFLTEEKANLIREFEQLFEGLENKLILAALAANVAEKFAEKKLKENVAPSSEVEKSLCQCNTAQPIRQVNTGWECAICGREIAQ